MFFPQSEFTGNSVFLLFEQFKCKTSSFYTEVASIRHSAHELCIWIDASFHTTHFFPQIKKMFCLAEALIDLITRSI